MRLSHQPTIHQQQVNEILQQQRLTLLSPDLLHCRCCSINDLKVNQSQVLALEHHLQQYYYPLSQLLTPVVYLHQLSNQVMIE